MLAWGEVRMLLKGTAREYSTWEEGSNGLVSRLEGEVEDGKTEFEGVVALYTKEGSVKGEF